MGELKSEKLKKIVITGPTGAVGMAMIKLCIENGIQVLAIVRKGSPRNERIPKNPLVKVVECDMSGYAQLDFSEDDKYDVFYHLAWAKTIGDGRNDMKAQTDNIRYTLDAVDLAKRLGCRRFVGAGSQAEYGRYEGMLNKNVPVNPENGYGMAKLCAGQMCRVECRKYEMQFVWTRILSVYGPYDGENTMVSSAIRSFLKGEKQPFTKAEQKWDYIYSEDAAEAMLLLGEKGKNEEVYCIGSGEARPLKEYIYKIKECTGCGIIPGIGEIPYGKGQVMYLCADITDLKRDTGFTVKYSFEEGIKRTIEWIKGCEV